MKKSIFALALFVVLILPVAHVEARGGSFGGRGGGFSAPRVSAPMRVSAPTRAPSVIPSRTTGFQNARATAPVTRTPSTYATQHTTVNNYGGYGGGGGFFSGYMMGSFMHPFGFGYGMYGGGYGYGVDAMGGAYYPSTTSMLLSWGLSVVFLIIFVLLVLWFIRKVGDLE